MKIMGSIDFRSPVFDIETETNVSVNIRFQVPHMGIAIPRTNIGNPSSQYSAGYTHTHKYSGKSNVVLE
jgi:hypothetical protein